VSDVDVDVHVDDGDVVVDVDVHVDAHVRGHDDDVLIVDKGVDYADTDRGMAVDMAEAWIVVVVVLWVSY
jgi:hypothetical protein